MAKRSYPQSSSLIEAFYYAADTFPNKPYLQYKEKDILINRTYPEIRSLVQYLSTSLYQLGVRNGDKVAIISDNMWKWIVTDLAILSLGAADVPRGSDSTTSEVAYIIKHSDAKVCFAENPTQASRIISNIESDSKLESVILLTGLPEDVTSAIPQNLALYTFDQLIDDGREKYDSLKDKLESIRKNLNEDTLATIIYTSGTTGVPKGVMLSHGNILTDIYSMLKVLFPTEKDRWVSVLPVWHVYERTIEYAVIVTCGSMAYSKPISKHLLPMLTEIQPTYMVSVPRIWESLYTGVVTKMKAKPALYKMFCFFQKIGIIYYNSKKHLSNEIAYFEKQPFGRMLKVKIASFFKMILLFIPDVIGDLLIFSKIRKILGGKLHVPISGGGKLPDYMDDFFNAAHINVLEGYGMTETSPVICVRTPGYLVPRTVGRPIPGVELMIGNDNFEPLENQHEKGHIYVRSKIVMQGYYKMPEVTAKIIKDGWLDTGDLGRLALNGNLQIVGRAKETIVLTGGENIEPAPIEEKILECDLIQSVMLVGQDKKYLAALVIPHAENLKEWAKNVGLQTDDYEALCASEEVNNELVSEIRSKVNMKNGFKACEAIKYVAVVSKPFEVGDELTNSLKMKRNYIADKYADIINETFMKG